MHFFGSSRVVCHRRRLFRSYWTAFSDQWRQNEEKCDNTRCEDDEVLGVENASLVSQRKTIMEEGWRPCPKSSSLFSGEFLQHSPIHLSILWVVCRRCIFRYEDAYQELFGPISFLFFEQHVPSTGIQDMFECLVWISSILIRSYSGNPSIVLSIGLWVIMSHEGRQCILLYYDNSLSQ